MSDIENVVLGGDAEPKSKSKAAKQASMITPTSVTDEAIYPAETLIAGGKLWFGKSRPRIAAILKAHRAEVATRTQVEKWLKG